MTDYQYNIPFIPDPIEDRIKDILVVQGQEVFQDLVAEQPWWKKISNTVTVTLTSLFTMLGVALTFGVIKPTLWVGLVFVSLFLLIQIIAVKATKNGLTNEVAVAIPQANPGYVAQKISQEVQSQIEIARAEIPERAQQIIQDLEHHIKTIQPRTEATIAPASPQSYPFH